MSQNICKKNFSEKNKCRQLIQAHLYIWIDYIIVSCIRNILAEEEIGRGKRHIRFRISNRFSYMYEKWSDWEKLTLFSKKRSSNCNVIESNDWHSQTAFNAESDVVSISLYNIIVKCWNSHYNWANYQSSNFIAWIMQTLQSFVYENLWQQLCTVHSMYDCMFAFPTIICGESVAHETIW